MKLYKSKGIVFRTTKYAETSIILDVFTETKGLRSFIVSGVRKNAKKSKSKASTFHHLNILDLVAYESSDNKLARLKEANISFFYQTIPFDVKKSSIALFTLEVAKNSILEKEANPDLFSFLMNMLMFIDKEDLSVLLPIKFLLSLTKYIGFLPSNNYHSSRPYFDLYNATFVINQPEKYGVSLEVSRALFDIRNTQIEHLNSLKISREIRNAAIDDLITYYKLHIDQFKNLKTLEVLRTIF